MRIYAQVFKKYYSYMHPPVFFTWHLSIVPDMSTMAMNLLGRSMNLPAFTLAYRILP